MNSLQFYNEKEAQCKEAIDLLLHVNFHVKWLINYYDLYLYVTYMTNNRPRITSANYKGQHFEHISKFGQLYRSHLFLLN